jgi:N-acetyl-S-(2-succino)cysteine monooxygenase
MELAAETAEVVFAAQSRLEGGKAFYASLKGRMAKCGRNPDHLKILPGLAVTVGRTEAEAKEKYARMQDLIHPDVGLGLLSRRLGFDLTGYPLDGPLPELPKNDVVASRADVVVEMAKRENLTIRQLYQRFAGARGHLEVVGTPVQIADTMQLWFEEHAADGFNVILPYFPGGLNDFVVGVIPELQRRGLFRTEYESTTLRGNLGLPVPANLHDRVRELEAAS